MPLWHRVNAARCEALQCYTILYSCVGKCSVAACFPIISPSHESLAFGDTGVPLPDLGFRPFCVVRDWARRELEMHMPVAPVATARRHVDRPFDANSMQSTEHTSEATDYFYSCLMADLAG